MGRFRIPIDEYNKDPGAAAMKVCPPDEIPLKWTIATDCVFLDTGPAPSIPIASSEILEEKIDETDVEVAISKRRGSKGHRKR